MATHFNIMQNIQKPLPSATNTPQPRHPRQGSARSSPGMYAIFTRDRLGIGQRWRTSRDDMKKPPCKALKSQISRQHEQEKEKNGIFVITKKLTVMNNFTFYSPTEFVFGKGSEEKTGELVKTYGGQKVLIVYGKGSAVKSGLLDRVKNSLDKAGLRHTELGGISPNPTDDKVYEGIEICRRETVDFILAVGGGSAIDTAKAIAAGTPYEGDFWDFYIKKAVPTQALPLGTVLTIPAAGSESSGNSVITKTDGLKKLSLRTDKLLRPRFAIMNPELTYTLPPYQTASGITDMLAHVMERYFSNTQGVETTDRLCEAVMTAIINEAPEVMTHPDSYDARANIMWCGTIAHNGICGVGREEDWTSHAMEHEISAVYGVTHGAGLAVIFPAWLTWMAGHNPHKPAQFARRVWHIADSGNTEADAKAGIQALKTFLRSIGMPLTFAGLGIDNPDIDLLVRKLHENKGEKIGCYCPTDRDASREIYELAL